jgi:hypothetical protein
MNRDPEQYTRKRPTPRLAPGTRIRANLRAEHGKKREREHVTVLRATIVVTGSEEDRALVEAKIAELINGIRRG